MRLVFRRLGELRGQIERLPGIPPSGLGPALRPIGEVVGAGKNPGKGRGFSRVEGGEASEKMESEARFRETKALRAAAKEWEGEMPA